MDIRDHTHSRTSEPSSLEYCRQTVSTYHTRAFWRFLEQAAGGEVRVLTAGPPDAPRGILPYAVKYHPAHGEVVNSLPWYGSHGGCLLRDTNDDDCRRALLGAFAERIRTPNVLCATLILSHEEEQHAKTYRQILAPDHEDYRVGQVSRLDLSDGRPSEALMRSYRQKTRNLVRKGLRQNFSIQAFSLADIPPHQPPCPGGSTKTGGNVDFDPAIDGWTFLQREHTAGMEAIGVRPKSPEQLEAIRQAFGHNARLWTAQGETGLTAALLLLEHHKTIEYLVPVIRHDQRPFQPLSALIHTAQVDAAKRGKRWWNWGGSGHGGNSLHHFKTGFGARDQRYSYMTVCPPATLKQAEAKLPVWQQVFDWFFLFPYAALERLS